MLTHPLRPPTVRRTRPRRVRGVFAAVALAVGLPSAAVAAPPGCPCDNPGGVTVMVTNKVVNPVSAGGGVVNFTGTGFTDGEVVSVKVDEGDVSPASPLPGSPADVFTVVTATSTGEIAGSVNLADAKPEYATALSSGKHRLRFLSSGRSTHTEFAVTSGGLPRPSTPGTTAHAYLGAEAGDPFGDVLVLDHGENATVPFRLTGFAPDQTVSIKVNDGAIPPATPAPGATDPQVWATVTTDAAGNASGGLVVPTNTGGTYWLRFLSSTPTSIWAPYVVLPAPVPPAETPTTPPTSTTPTTPADTTPTCPTRPRFNSVIYSDGVTSFYYRPQPGQKILGARRLGTKTLTARLATAKGRSTLPRLEYTTAKVVDAGKLPWFARKVGPRRVVTAIMSNADSSAYSGVRLSYRPKNGTYAKLILPNGNVQRLVSSCPPVTGYKTIYAQNIVVNRRSR